MVCGVKTRRLRQRDEGFSLGIIPNIPFLCLWLYWCTRLQNKKKRIPPQHCGRLNPSYFIQPFEMERALKINLLVYIESFVIGLAKRLPSPVF